ncbi:Hypothetical protein, putative [Aduncisulcus paluster]|uniref:Uncharacterized protein n=1 Tax=Aduncisulcus paluster TaxID=2918883 RepID=A0ABQ5KA33_9EUKA|nr:Hypothetical protein, putative [Aduncisulcus paluster]
MKSILDTIDAISFSKEKKRGKRWFVAELGKYWVQIRDIVSDSDKIDALGAIGVQRARQFTKERYSMRGKEISEVDLIKEVIEHAEEKLLRLMDEYVVTVPGKHLCRPKHDDFVLELNRMKKEMISHL